MKFCLGGMTLAELVKNDKQAKKAAKGMWEEPTLPQTGEFTGHGFSHKKATYLLTIECEIPWRGGTFKEFCEHWQVVEWHTPEPPK